jgi:hypothetical protein
VAVTLFTLVIETEQLVPEKLVHPVQVFRIESGPGVAVRVTVSPFASTALHTPAAQVIPAPSTEPVPLTETFSA